jgi:hypothetical protein
MPSSIASEKPDTDLSGRDADTARVVVGPRGAPWRGVRSRLRQLRFWSGAGYLRETWDWIRCKDIQFARVGDLQRTLQMLDRASSLEASVGDAESPIFLLGNGWRTGSTLLQRILVTDPKLLLWGEPFGEMALISELAEVLSRLSTFPDLERRYAPEDVTASPNTAAAMAKSWIATLYPHGTHLRAALRSLLGLWLGQPAAERGFSLWGFKEVRLGATEATLLQWLYPNARFVVLSRNPFDCYLSLSDSGWDHVYYRRPDIRVDSAAGFARHWNRLAVGWSDLPASFPLVHIKYEDLVAGRVDFRKLESWLGLAVNEKEALREVVGHTAVRRSLNWYERLIIKHEAGAGMRLLGYSE